MRTFPSPRRRALLAGVSLALLAASCSTGGNPTPTSAGGSPTPSGPTGSTGPTGRSSAAPTGSTSPVPTGTRAVPRPTTTALTLRSTPVSVPASMRKEPFDRPRALSVPVGWRVSVVSRIPRPRFMVLAPDGALLVSQPSGGSVTIIRRGVAPAPFLTGLTFPHDLVIATLSGRTWLYVAESNRVRRHPYSAGDRTAQPGETVVAGLPDASTPELKGAYAHALKNIAIGPEGGLYVSIASTCNVCVSDTRSDPRRAAIYRYGVTGTDRRLYATGLRNAEGLDFVPNTAELWVVVNNRDNIAYPEHRDVDGDGKDDYGKVLPSYVDNHPPELFLRVKDGGFYGWPFCNSNPDRTIGMRDMPYDRDVEMNPDGRVDCATATLADQGIPAHSAPLGLTFLQRTAVPRELRTGAVVAYHGSWNRTRRTGYKVVWFPWDSAGRRPGPAQDLVTGWVDVSGQDIWGRPVDVVADRDGTLLVSDDYSGTIYRLTPPG